MVNLGFLFLFAKILGVQSNIASALAIELSIINNFLLNDRWTFGDGDRQTLSFWRRGMRFHLVSGVGALGQFLIFVIGNILWLVLLFPTGDINAYFESSGDWISRYVVHPLLSPPKVGPYMYLSQLCGIGAAVLWNFLANSYWTWKLSSEERP